MAAKITYSQEYVDGARAQLEAQVASFYELAAAVDGADEDGTLGAAAALADLEPEFFNNLLVVLDAYFADRPAHPDGSDADPLAEVRELRSALLTNDGIMAASRPLDPSTSVLGYRAGEVIRLDAEQFLRISDAFLRRVERTYPAGS